MRELCLQTIIKLELQAIILWFSAWWPTLYILDFKASKIT